MKDNTKLQRDISKLETEKSALKMNKEIEIKVMKLNQQVEQQVVKLTKENNTLVQDLASIKNMMIKKEESHDKEFKKLQAD